MVDKIEKKSEYGCLYTLNCHKKFTSILILVIQFFNMNSLILIDIVIVLLDQGVSLVRNVSLLTVFHRHVGRKVGIIGHCELQCDCGCVAITDGAPRQSSATSQVF